MQYAILAIRNRLVEQKRANLYPNIRITTVGQFNSSFQPALDLLPHKTVPWWGGDTGQIVEQGWTVANSTNVALHGGFGTFSAVCWVFGRTISDALSPPIMNGTNAIPTGNIPIGLISSNWGGTAIERWATDDTFTSCGRVANHEAPANSKEPAGGDTTLYNSLIAPYTVGPMQLSGLTWWQGEQNTPKHDNTTLYSQYACMFQGLIRSWRDAFKQPSLYFGFVQLSTFCQAGSGWLAIPGIRAAQMAALSLPNVGYATAADWGGGCNIHCPDKEPVGQRLATSALALVYGWKNATWRSPTYASAVDSTNTGAGAAAPNRRGSAAASVTVTLDHVSTAGLTTDVYPHNHNSTPRTGGILPTNCSHILDLNRAPQCVWASLQVRVGGGGGGAIVWVNATVTTDGTGQHLILTDNTGTQASKVLASAYAWGPIPMMNAYDKASTLPVLGWNRTL